MAKTTKSTRRKKKKDDEPEDWRNSEAKKLLFYDILSGKVTASMDYLVVKNMRPQFAPYRDERFRDNFKALCEAIERDKERMQQDIVDYGHDLNVMKALREQEPLERLPWHRTDCPDLLKADIDDGKYPTLSPQELYATRDEYQAFTLDEFRKHIHQERADREKKKNRSTRKKIRAAARKEIRALLHDE